MMVLTPLESPLPDDVAARQPVTKARRQLESVLDDFIEEELIAAGDVDRFVNC